MWGVMKSKVTEIFEKKEIANSIKCKKGSDTSYCEARKENKHE